MQTSLSAQYWEMRYETHNTPWDIGGVSPPLKRYFDQLQDKNLSILIPGAGFGHEAIYLHKLGFGQVWVCDWAKGALDDIRAKAPSYPAAHLLQHDFFRLEQKFDLIIEQTFFCAISPVQRVEYARQAARLLRQDGKFAGLLFEDEFPAGGPPFGGNRKEYKALFEPFFHIHTLEITPFSISPRAGREVFFEMSKKE